MTRHFRRVRTFRNGTTVFEGYPLYRYTVRFLLACLLSIPLVLAERTVQRLLDALTGRPRLGIWPEWLSRRRSVLSALIRSVPGLDPSGWLGGLVDGHCRPVEAWMVEWMRTDDPFEDSIDPDVLRMSRLRWYIESSNDRSLFPTS